MKPFTLEPGMLTLRGVFYPTGYMFLMYPTLDDAYNAERKLRHAGCNCERVSLLTPDDILEKIVHTVGNADMPLPSPGTEADTVRHFAKLASRGHHALMIQAPSAEESTHVMNVLRDTPISYGQKYRHLAIEDLVE